MVLQEIQKSTESYNQSILLWESESENLDSKFQANLLFKQIGIRVSGKNPNEQQLEIELLPQPDFSILHAPLITGLNVNVVHAMQEKVTLPSNATQPSGKRSFHFYFGDSLQSLEQVRDLRIVLRARHKQTGRDYDLANGSSRIDFVPALELLPAFIEMRNFLKTHTFDPYLPPSAQQEHIISEYLETLERFQNSLHRAVGEKRAFDITSPISKELAIAARQKRFPSPRNTLTRQLGKLSNALENTPTYIDYLEQYQDCVEATKWIHESLNNLREVYQRERLTVLLPYPALASAGTLSATD